MRLTWHRTHALVRAVAMAAALTLVAVLMRRPDLAVLAAPFALGAVIGTLTRPRADVEARVSARPLAVLEGDETEATVSVRGDGPLDLLAVTVAHGAGLKVEGVPPGAGARYARVLPFGTSGRAELSFPLTSVRWGRANIGPVVVRAVAGHGMIAAVPELISAVPVQVWPLRGTFTATDAVPRPEGMVGLHRSRLLGEGSDIAEVRPFAPGDRLRRINWRVSLREQTLHVTDTLSDRDTDVVLCLDTRYEIWPGGRAYRVNEPGATESSLDGTVRAAAEIAEHYLRTGDRVGMVDLGAPMRRVRQGAGRSHLVQLFQVLMEVRGDRHLDRSAVALAMSEIPPGALVVVFSPLVGETTYAWLGTLARGGHTVVAVDTLPVDAGPHRYGEWTDLAWRLWRMERDNAVGRLGELGVPVVPWRGTGSLDGVLRDVSRAARAPRLRR